MREYLENLIKNIFLIEKFFKENNIRTISRENTYIFKIYGDALFYLSEFSKNLSEDLEDKNLKELSEYINYTCDFILSQNKESFFREKPNAPKLGNFFLVDYPLYKEGMDILESINRGIDELERLKVSIYKFYFYIFQFFSFIYSLQKKEGIFLLFKYEKNLSLKLLNIIIEYLNNIEKAKNPKLQFRAFSYIVRPIILLSNLEEKNINVSQIDTNNDTISEIYHKIFLILLENPSFQIEPFSWKIANYIWHVGAILQDLPEKNLRFEKNKEKSEKEVDFTIDSLIGEIKELIEKLINNLENISLEEKFTFSIKDGGFNIIFQKLLESERKIYHKLYSALYKGENTKDISNIYKKEENESEKRIKVEDFKLDIEEDFIEKLQFVPYEEEFKLHKIIEKFQRKSLYILYIYSLFLKRNYPFVEKNLGRGKLYEFIGFFWSGAALLHTALKGLGIDNLRIWSFKVFPYIKTHPLHKHLPKHSEENFIKKEINILLSDESLKTGYTYNLYKYYFQKELSKEFVLNNIKNIVLWNFENYEKLTNIESGDDFISLFNVNKSPYGFYINRDNIDFLKYLEKSDENKIPYDSFLNNLTKKIGGNFNNVLKEKIEYIEYIDFMWFFSDSRCVYTLANSIAKKIMEDVSSINDEEITINLYSPSQEGRILNTLTAILLFLKLEKKFKIKFGRGQRENKFRYLIDISFNTGFTAYTSLIGKTSFNLSSVPDEILKEKEIKKRIENEGFKILTVKDLLNM